jgi:hypothetical protein
MFQSERTVEQRLVTARRCSQRAFGHRQRARDIVGTSGLAAAREIGRREIREDIWIGGRKTGGFLQKPHRVVCLAEYEVSTCERLQRRRASLAEKPLTDARDRKDHVARWRGPGGGRRDDRRSSTPRTVLKTTRKPRLDWTAIRYRSHECGPNIEAARLPRDPQRTEGDGGSHEDERQNDPPAQAARLWLCAPRNQLTHSNFNAPATSGHRRRPGSLTILSGLAIMY